MKIYEKVYELCFYGLIWSKKLKYSVKNNCCYHLKKTKLIQKLHSYSKRRCNSYWNSISHICDKIVWGFLFRAPLEFKTDWCWHKLNLKLNGLSWNDSCKSLILSQYLVLIFFSYVLIYDKKKNSKFKFSFLSGTSFPITNK